VGVIYPRCWMFKTPLLRREPRLAYMTSRIPSLARAANDYIEILASRFPLTSPLKADIVFVHAVPNEVDSILAHWPGIRHKYLILCSVWEATELPDCMKQQTSVANEIWTCSTYCKEIFERCHHNVVQIPLVVRRNTGFSQHDLRIVTNWIGFDYRLFYFLTITREGDKQKNTLMLANCFKRLAREMPFAHLLVKSTAPHCGVCCHQDTNITYLTGYLSEQQLNALYSLSAAYISAHHAEGWGLTLSDAMLLRRPVIATDYPGNLEFMTRSNSALIRCNEEYIRPEDCFYLFDSNMKWGYLDIEDLGSQILTAYEGHSRLTCARVDNAYDEVMAFSQEHVRDAVFQRGFCNRILNAVRIFNVQPMDVAGT
jgi:glycosyltransferase involved in cell wall biosynthesis